MAISRLQRLGNIANRGEMWSEVLRHRHGLESRKASRQASDGVIRSVRMGSKRYLFLSRYVYYVVI